MPRSTPAPRPLLFDFDGTLIDSAPEIQTAVNHMLAEHGLPPLTLAQIHSFVGDGARTLVERCLSHAGRPSTTYTLPALTRRYMEIYESLRPDPACTYPGVAETLAALQRRGHPMALVTNKPEQATHGVLAAVGLTGFFEVVIGGDTLPVRKPDPAPVREALRRLDVPATDAVMIGDSINDMLSGRAAGLRVIAVSYGYAHGPVADLGADRVIDRFEDLLALV